MTSVTVVARVVLIVFFVDNSRTITVNGVKKAIPGGPSRDEQSLTFSSNGEDQLIFSDAAFPVRDGGPRAGASSVRRAGDEKSAIQFFESGWRPLYKLHSEDSDDKVSDQLPQEAVQQTAAVADPSSNRTTKFYRFSLSDIMHALDNQSVHYRTGKSPDAIQFEESSSGEERANEVVHNDEEGKDVQNTTKAALQMLKFEESDRMKFDGKSKGFKFSEDSSESRPKTGEDSVQPANYEVYVIENLLMNTTGTSRPTKFNRSSPRNRTETHPRILKSAGDIPANQEGTQDMPRNSSKHFRFEEQQKTAEKSRFEKRPVSSFKFHDTIPSRDGFKFPRYEESMRNQESQFQSGGTFKFHETDNRPHGSSSAHLRFENVESKPFKFTNEPTAVTRSPGKGNDQYYTVKATIQIDGYDNPIITPPSVPVPVTTRRPKMKKGKIYNQHGVDIRKQDGFNYQPPTDYDNYLQQAAANAVNQYQSNFQIPPTPFIPPVQQSPPNNNPYYQTQPSPGTPNPPYDPNTHYIQSYLENYPVPQQPYPYQSQPLAEGSSNYLQQQSLPSNGGAQSDSPLSAQSVFGFLQSIFNFAPGTFGSYPTTLTDNKGNEQSQSGTGSPSPIMAVSAQLRKALDNISDNDELQCVPKLICMMSRRTTGQGFSTYVNRGLLSTILSAVPDSSPWLKFSRAALLGYGIGANSCDVYYPKCPKDESEIIYYLNNHRGGFFRFFNDGQNGLSRG